VIREPERQCSTLSLVTGIRTTDDSLALRSVLRRRGTDERRS
jgi:hypothetical protein